MGSEDMGGELRENNEKIVECIKLLREQRDELGYIIEKQCEERKRLETEMERITYKLCLLNKSLAQRIRAKSNYDKTLVDVEERYQKLVEDSKDLLVYIKNEFNELESMINKKTSTEDYTETCSAETGDAKYCKCQPPVKESNMSNKSVKNVRTKNSEVSQTDPARMVEKAA